MTCGQFGSKNSRHMAHESEPIAQREDWNSTAPNWVRRQAMFFEDFAPLGDAAMECANVVRGERVLDTGCGCGTTTLELARRVGPDGWVMGLDISAPMLALAKDSAKEAAIENVRFECADAQTYVFADETLDLVFSRFGVMFFDDPRAAFANLLGALRRGGRLAFVCWRRLADNQWASVLGDAVSQHVDVEPPKPGMPGPFAFADGDWLKSLVESAGFDRVAVEAFDEATTVGGQGSLDEIAQNLTRFGFIGAAIRRATVNDTTQIVASLKEAIAPFATNRGVRMRSGVWILTARRD